MSDTLNTSLGIPISRMTLLSAVEDSNIFPILANGDNARVTATTLREYTSKQIKLESFGEIWDNLWGEYGQYQESSGIYSGNGINMNYDQAILSYLASIRFNPSLSVPNNIRTIAPINAETTGYKDIAFVATFKDCSELEAVRFSGYRILISRADYMFENCTRLKNIYGNLVFQGSTEGTFSNCTSLKSISIYDLKQNLNISAAANLDYDSLNLLVANAANTGSITVVVHSAVYAKLSGNASADVEPDELEAWQGLMAAAASKGIVFATR